MSALMKLMPLAALAGIGYANSDALTKSLNLINQVQVEATSSIEMQNIAQVVAHEYIESNTIPLENFSEWLKENVREASGKSTRDHSRDMWGTPYRIARSGKNGFEIQCAGPDKTWGTKDDIKLVQSLDQYGGVGEAGVTQVAPAQATQAASPAAGPSDAAASPPPPAEPASAEAAAGKPAAAAPPPEPAPAPAPAPAKQPYHWKRG